MLITQFLDNPMAGLAVAIAILLALTVHEFAHAWSASLLGDDTAEDLGRLTLNPMPHIDPLGLLMLLFVGFGWGKPVPVNPFNFKNPKKDNAIVAFAGPLSNLIFGGIVILLFRFLASTGLEYTNLLYVFLLYLVNINLVLMLFNLIPIPPLDGSKILFAFLPRKYHHIEVNLEQNGPMILLFVILLDSFSPVSIFGILFRGAFEFVNNLLI